jgi:hypothetical protein
MSGHTVEVNPEWLVGTVDEIQSILSRAQKGDPKALPALRKLLAPAGAADALGGNLANRAIQSLLAGVAGDNLCYRETVTRKMDELRAELAGPNPSAIERLLAERAVVCWLNLYQLEMSYGSKTSKTLPPGNYYQKCIDRAHKRYLSALKSLVEVRKLALPAVQVNIARKQVNVAAGTA